LSIATENLKLGIKVEEQKQFEIQGGSLEKSLSGETQLDLKAMAKEAWDLSKERKSEILQGAMLVVCVAMFIFWGLLFYFDVSDLAQVPPKMEITFQILLIVFSTPIIVAMLLIGMFHSVGVKPKFIALLKHAMGSSLVILLALLVAALTDVGMRLLILPGLYLSMGTGFSLMLLVEKKLAPSQAIIQSLKVFNKYWAPLGIFYFVSLIALIIGMFSFGVAYIWLIPFYINFKGVLYRELFGVKVPSVKGQSNQDETVFHA
jgi:hypothetical protein